MTNEAFNLRFQQRPSPVIAEHRPLYKLGQILLILHLASRAGRSTLARLQLFNWALKSPDRQQHLVVAATSKELKIPAWGFDPALAIALRYSVAEELILETARGYEITDVGIEFVKEVLMDDSLFTAERAFFQKIGKSITETMVDSVANGWGT